jgi:hypothetical protein
MTKNKRRTALEPRADQLWAMYLCRNLQILESRSCRIDVSEPPPFPSPLRGTLPTRTNRNQPWQAWFRPSASPASGQSTSPPPPIGSFELDSGESGKPSICLFPHEDTFHPRSARYCVTRVFFASQGDEATWATAPALSGKSQHLQDIAKQPNGHGISQKPG